jgi:hypothetical protein
MFSEFVLAKYNTILDVLNNFDLYASRVAYTGDKVYFTEKSHFAQKIYGIEYVLNYLFFN